MHKSNKFETLASTTELFDYHFISNKEIKHNTRVP